MFSVVTRLLGFVFKIYLSRIMSTTELGIYNLTFSVFMVLITIVASSIPLTISKIASTNKSLKKEFKTNYSVTSSLLFSLIVSIILTVLIIICKPLLIKIIGSNLGYDIILALLPSIIFSALYSQIRGYLWGNENYFGVSIVEFIEQILRIAFCILFVYLDIFKSSVISVGVALSIACGISSGYGFYLYFKNGGRFQFKRGYLKEIVNSSIPLTAVRLFGSILQPIVAVILPLMLSKLGMDRDLALSELGIIMGMSLPLLSIPSTIIASLCMILVPRISSCNENQQQRLHFQVNNYLLFTLVCIFMFIPIFIALGIPICDFVFNNTQSGIYLCYGCWIVIPMGIAQITTSILNALNQEHKTFIYYMISSIFMFLAVLILPKYIKIMAMIFGMGISNIILSILNLRKIKQITSYESKLISKLTTQLLIIMPIIWITKLTYNWLHLIANEFITIAICSIISITAYFILLFVFNVINPKSVINFINKTFKYKTFKNKISNNRAKRI